MIKQINVEVDRDSWREQPPAFQHPFPPELSNFPSPCALNIWRAFLWNGVLSIPALIPRWGLAIQWAQIRYLGMINDATDDLRIHPAARELDAHYKTVMSDDWGVGLTLEWLNTRFNYRTIEHGMSYLKRLERQGLATFQGSVRRRGPKKCPDFVGITPDRKLHLIECKGNQTSQKALIGQLAKGRSQKQNVLFTDEGSLVGQRLVTGVAIASASSKWNSVLRVEDPAPEGTEGDRCQVTTGDPATLRQELQLGTLARGLALAGETELLARLLPGEVAEDGDRPLMDEFRPSRRSFEVGGSTWVGRVDRVRLPTPLRINGELVRWFAVRYGVNPQFLGQLTDLPANPRLRLAEMLSERAYLKHQAVDAGDIPNRQYAAIRWGDAFIADMTLR